MYLVERDKNHITDRITFEFGMDFTNPVQS